MELKEFNNWIEKIHLRDSTEDLTRQKKESVNSKIKQSKLSRPGAKEKRIKKSEDRIRNLLSRKT